MKLGVSVLFSLIGSVAMAMPCADLNGTWVVKAGQPSGCMRGDLVINQKDCNVFDIEGSFFKAGYVTSEEVENGADFPLKRVRQTTWNSDKQILQIDEILTQVAKDSQSSYLAKYFGTLKFKDAQTLVIVSEYNLVSMNSGMRDSKNYSRTCEMKRK